MKLNALVTCISHDLDALAQRDSRKILTVHDILHALTVHSSLYYVNYAKVAGDSVIALEEALERCKGYRWMHGYAVKAGAFPGRRGRAAWTKDQLDSAYVTNLTF